jgi:hypothetical protein
MAFGLLDLSANDLLTLVIVERILHSAYRDRSFSIALFLGSIVIFAEKFDPLKMFGAGGAAV